MMRSSLLAFVIVAIGCGSLYAASAATQPASASQPAEEKGKTDPPGLPLEAKLVLKKDTYQIKEGQSGEAFARGLKERGKPPKQPPAPPEVEMTFELTNTGKKSITIPLGSDASSLNLKLEGPGAVTIPYVQMRTMEYRIGKPVTIGPGKSITIPIARLLHGMRGDSSASYWTEAGTYTLTASYVTPVEGLDLKEDQQATITAAPVKVKVTEPAK